ncbi:hypothetical protein ACH44C_31960 [Streptomyces purpureus]|uniref:hypothetical protein n=1 Tax=Streptomyces purpureus TaxID=1951 RepID=UPI003788C132
MATPKHRCKKSNSSVTTLVAARPDLGVDRPLNVGPLTAPAGAPEVGRGPHLPLWSQPWNKLGRLAVRASTRVAYAGLTP